MTGEEVLTQFLSSRIANKTAGSVAYIVDRMNIETNVDIMRIMIRCGTITACGRAVLDISREINDSHKTALEIANSTPRVAWRHMIQRHIAKKVLRF
jgi:hypothetical protein